VNGKDAVLWRVTPCSFESNGSSETSAHVYKCTRQQVLQDHDMKIVNIVGLFECWLPSITVSTYLLSVVRAFRSIEIGFSGNKISHDMPAVGTQTNTIALSCVHLPHTRVFSSRSQELHTTCIVSCLLSKYSLPSSRLTISGLTLRLLVLNKVYGFVTPLTNRKEKDSSIKTLK
jgi:hypothetical protein